MNNAIRFFDVGLSEERRYVISDDRYLNERELSMIIGRSIPSLQRDRHKRQGPPYHKIGKNVRYLWRDVKEYLAATRVETDF